MLCHSNATPYHWIWGLSQGWAVAVRKALIKKPDALAHSELPNWEIYPGQALRECVLALPLIYKVTLTFCRPTSISLPNKGNHVTEIIVGEECVQINYSEHSPTIENYSCQVATLYDDDDAPRGRRKQILGVRRLEFETRVVPGTLLHLNGNRNWSFSTSFSLLRICNRNIILTWSSTLYLSHPYHNQIGIEFYLSVCRALCNYRNFTTLFSRAFKINSDGVENFVLYNIRLPWSAEGSRNRRKDRLYSWCVL